MSDVPQRMELLDEPVLQFAEGQCIEHPRTGLSLFGPYSSRGIETPRDLNYALVGTKDGIQAFQGFASFLERPIFSPPKMDEVLWPHFPGFEEATHARFSALSACNESVDEERLLAAVNQGDDHKRVFDVVNAYLDGIAAIARKDDPVDVVLCVVPEIVYQNCRPLSHVTKGIGKRLSAKEIRARRQSRDLFGTYDPEQYEYSLDFRRQIKARSMEHRMPIQIVRDTTLRLSDENEFGKRQLTPLSDRAWNLSTALLYKGGGKPWKLPSARPGVCYVGIAFKRTSQSGRTACSAAQMFLDDGDGVVFLGDYGSWYSPYDKQCHLTRDAARRLLAGVLETYAEQHGKPLKEVFLHSRSTIDDEEWAGYMEACPAGATIVGIRVAPDRYGLRGYRPGSRPIMRGAFWRLSERRAYLWASGFKPVLRTYDGSNIPEPLAIEIQHGDSDIRLVAEDILRLTKLNYNTCKVGESQPVTVHFSDAVGEILVANKAAKYFLPNFKYYV